MLNPPDLPAIPSSSDGVEIVAETPSERARRRFDELRRAASSVLEVLAHIYLDEDWKHLNDPTSGRPFLSFGAFVGHAIGGSASNARRYRQAVETLVAPLKQLAAQGVRIPVTPHDVARLGTSGAATVVQAAPEALEGITEPAEQSEALRGLLDQVIGDLAIELGRIVDDGVPEIPATVPPSALPPSPTEDEDDPWNSGPADATRGGGADRDPWGSDPDDEAGEEYRSGNRPPVAQDGNADSGRGARGGAASGLRNVVDDVLRLDPSAVTATAGGQGAGMAADCLAAAQRLARIAQLLKTIG